MEESGHDTLVVAGYGALHRYGYLHYLAGYCPWLRPGYAVLARDRAAVVLVPTAADAAAAASASPEADVRWAPAGEPLTALLVTALQEVGGPLQSLGVVGLDDIVPAGVADRVRGALPCAHVRDATRLVAGLKARKSDEELRALRGAATIADAGFACLVDGIGLGVTGWDLSAAVERAVRRRGATEVLVIVGTGPHFGTRPDARPLAAGELVTGYVEVAGPGGYWVEQAALFALGGLDDARARLADGCLAVLAEGVRLLQPGRRAAEVAAGMASAARTAGLTCGTTTGHGVGVDDQDPPLITSTDDTPLAADMVIALHPQVSPADGVCGASAGATYHVTEGGPVRLSAAGPRLHVIDPSSPSER